MRIWCVSRLGASLLGLALIGLSALGLSAPLQAAACEESILPDAAKAGGRDSCEYTHIPHASFTYRDGKVKATWEKEYQVLEMYVLEDWNVVAPYLPGRELPLQRDRSKAYDFVGRLRNVRTQEEVLSITPMWCRNGVSVAPTGGCRGYAPAACDTNDDATCPDGTHLRVSCEGDTGTCSTCGTEGKNACCRSRQTTTITTPIGSITIRTVHIETNQPCPPNAPEPVPTR